MIELPETIINEIKHHASIEFPKESCGVIIVFKGKYKYIACKNISNNNEQFIIDPEDYAKAEDMGTICLIVHSHPNLPPLPSEADLVSCEKSGIPWLIVNWPQGNIYQFKPSGYIPKLTGRVFIPGILDCYTIIRDYYKLTHNIELTDYYREDNWWKKGLNLYLDNVEKEGFYKVNDLKEHDVIFMQVSSDVPNHAGIYIGNTKVLHHQVGRLSSIDVYGGWYKKITTSVYRHKDV